MQSGVMGLIMLGLIVMVIMLGFPTAFTLMGLGMVFGFYNYYTPGQALFDNQVFNLMVQRAFGAMNNETLLSIPLFVLMGYVMERGALVDKMFHAVQLAFRRLPGSLAVATLVICTFWGIASGLVGAVVVLMGVIAMRPMLNAGYDTRLAAGVITAGGTLGILIPPSVMIIVYAAVAGQSVVKLYAAAMFPGFFLAFLYLVYIIGWVLIDPKVAPKLPPEQLKAKLSNATAHIAANYSPKYLWACIQTVINPAKALSGAGVEAGLSKSRLFARLITALTPVLMTVITMGLVWWYVVIHSQADNNATKVEEKPVAVVAAKTETPVAAPVAVETKKEASDVAEPPGAEKVSTKSASDVAEPPGAEKISTKSASDVVEPPGAASTTTAKAETTEKEEVLQDMSAGEGVNAPKGEAVPEGFYTGFGITCLVLLGLLAYYYRKFDAEQYEILSLLVTSVMPLGVLTIVVLLCILMGWTTATESAAVGAAGAFIMAFGAGTLNFKRIKEAVFLTAKTTSMVCWLFVGSALFSAVFAQLGGQGLVERWVLSMDLAPWQFLLLSQAIIFILGWPLEWTEIIVIFVPIFLPLLAHFQIDPILWGVLVFVNLQAAFLSPPVAMSAFYLKGVSPPHVTINQIFAGMMPYMLIVILCMVLLYIWPSLTLWLPKYLYGG